MSALPTNSPLPGRPAQLVSTGRPVRGNRCVSAWLGRVALLAGLAGLIWLPLSARAAGPAEAMAPILRIEAGGHASLVRRLAVSEARGLVVTASDDKTARVWALGTDAGTGTGTGTGKQTLVLRPPIGPGDIGRLYGAAIHPTRALVAVGGSNAAAGQRGAIYLFDLDSGLLVRAIDAGSGDVKRLAWSADGTVLLAGYADVRGGAGVSAGVGSEAGAGAGAVRAFSLDGKLLHDEASAGAVYGLAVGPQGLVAATDFSGRVIVLRAAAQAVSRVKVLPVQPRDPIGVAFSPDEQRLLVGYNRALTLPDVLDVGSGRVLQQLKPQGATVGQFGVVAWSRDGNSIAVGGSASATGRRFPVWIFSAADGAQRSAVEVASNSVTDLTELAGGRFAYASADGSWGIVGAALERQVAGELNDLRGAANLVASGDLRRVGWAYDFGARRASFDVATRTITASSISPASAAGMNAALTKRSLMDTPLEAGFDAQGSARKRQSAQVNGVTIPFEGVELGSCGTYLRGSRDAILGTTKALYRIDGTGRTLWRLPTAAEVNAVVASDDGRLLVTAMSDGLIQWRRAADGAELLSFLARPDGRWIVWTPEGYFDASLGADTLAGWVLNRGADNAAELFSLGRFRDRYQRPDVIDRVLETLDTKAAIVQAAPSARASMLAAAPVEAEGAGLKAAQVPVVEGPRDTANAATTTTAVAEIVPARPVAPPPVALASAVPPAATPPAPPAIAPPAVAATAAVAAAPPPVAVPLTAAPPSAAEFPPSLVALGPRKLTADGADLQIKFALRAADGGRPPKLELRVDGRPLAPRGVELPARMDGKAQGVITFDLATEGATVVLLAKDGAGVSEPLSYAVEQSRAAPAPAAVAPAPTLIPAPMSPPLPAQPLGVAGVAAAVAALAAQAAPPPAAAMSAPVAVRAPPPGRKLFVLAVGISDYERPAYRLGLPAKDATDFTAVMAAQKAVYREVNTRLLTNARANRLAIRQGLKWLVDSVGPNDVGMLFLAGHGVNVDNGQYYFLNYEANHDRLAETGLSEREIRDALRDIRGRTLFFVDTCFSGNVIGDARTSRREISRMANALASAENGVVVFAASSGRQESEEKAAWGNGAFTKVLVEGLRGRADLTRTGRITFKGLDFYVSEEVRLLTQERQTPVTIIPVGVPDFVVAAPL